MILMHHLLPGQGMEGSMYIGSFYALTSVNGGLWWCRRKEAVP